MNKGMFTSATPEWATPQHIFDELDAEFKFTLDPCATKKNAKCDRYFTRKQNGLKQSWAGERVFMNPPYGDEIADWMSKAWEESQKGALVACLIPARTDTRWWHDWAMKVWPHGIRLRKGRIKFIDQHGKTPGSPTFPSAIVIFRGDL